jgi:2-polyprenyl-6-methoxyphenol hydroxylase-like FAD-dependent oxidoreductase
MFFEGSIQLTNPIYATAKDEAGPGALFSSGGGKELALQQIADGSYLVYMGLMVAEDFHLTTTHLTTEADGTEAARHLLLSSSEFYSSWSSQLRTFIEHAEGPFRPWPLYHLPADQVSWDQETAPRGITLIGDAAHVSTPFAGEGVNCSMLDAVTLFDCIVKHHSDGQPNSLPISDDALQAALVEYERDMFPRGSDLIQRSNTIGDHMYSQNGAQQFLDYFMAVMKDGAE